MQSADQTSARPPREAEAGKIGPDCDRAVKRLFETKTAPFFAARSLSSFRLEVHRYAVDAVAQPGRRRAVREYVAEMAAAAAAMHLGADHAVAPVDRVLDRARLRIVE